MAKFVVIDVSSIISLAWRPVIIQTWPNRRYHLVRTTPVLFAAIFYLCLKVSQMSRNIADLADRNL